MKRLVALAAVFAVAFSFTLGLTLVTTDSVTAKPNDCLLTIEPFYDCQPSARCKTPGEEYCYLCHGWDMYGEPCLCTRVGCMVPPQ